MSYYPEPESHIRDKVKVLPDLSNYATKKELEHATGVDTSNLATKNFVALKLVSAIFLSFFLFFHQMIAHQEL